MQRRHEIAIQTGHFSPELFYGMKISAQEPWLYFVWYGFLSALVGFISGIVWTPIAIAVFGTFYSGISGSYVLNPAGEIFRTGSQIFTSILFFVYFIIGIYRRTLTGHKELYLLPTIRFKGDEYTQIPFIVENGDFQDLSQQIPIPGFHVFKVALTIPYSGYVKTLKWYHRIANYLTPKNYSTFQPVDYGLIVSEGDKAETVRPHPGRTPYYGLLLECPLTLPLGLTVYYGKQYEKNGKPVPVMFAHDSPYSVEKVQKLAALGGLKFDEIKSLDTMFQTNLSIEKDYRIEELESELVRQKVQAQSEIQQKDQEIADILQAHGLATSNTPVGGDLNQRLATKWGLIGIGIFAGVLILIFELARYGILR
jgi:hypothetical protein